MRHTEAPAGWLTSTQAARALGVSKETVRRYAAGGLLESCDTAGGIIVRATDVMRMTSKRRSRSAS